MYRDRRLISCLTLFLVVQAVAQNNTQTTAQNNAIQLDQEVLQNSATSLYQQITQALQEGKADPEKQHLNVAFAFSTGHFPKDPTMAQAAREIANLLVREHLIEGDRISAYAWEMNVWSHPGADLNPYTLPASLKDDAAKQQVNRLWPLSAQPATTGGHDTEQAIVELAGQLQNQDTVLVLLTNTAYSVASSDKKPIGTRDESYQQVLKGWKRMDSNSASGASIQLPFQEQGGKTRTLDAVIVTPNAYQAAALTKSRTELLTEAREAAKSPANLLWVYILAGVVVLGALAFGLTRSRKPASGTPAPRAVKSSKLPLQLEVQGKKFSVPGPKDPALVCHIRKDQGIAAADRVVLIPDKNLPSDLAQLERTPEGILIKVMDGVKLHSIDGQPVQKPVLPLKVGLYRIELRGQFQEKSTLPPRPFQHELKVRISEQSE
ncbi:hypothetical protein [Deinococcus misasensis]|uniref:hypothetical protein n=1 Tax=Deinococcus misasensis TaxID=392413 RepID=UPI00054DE0AB|nr:hypothetical protein [Deinococcus misasensis]